MKKLFIAITSLVNLFLFMNCVYAEDERFRYTNVPVETVLEEFSEYYNKVILLDSEISDRKVSGVFNRDSLARNLKRIFKEDNLIITFNNAENSVVVKVFGSSSPDMVSFNSLSSEGDEVGNKGESAASLRESEPGVVFKGIYKGERPEVKEVEAGVVFEGIFRNTEEELTSRESSDGVIFEGIYSGDENEKGAREVDEGVAFKRIVKNSETENQVRESEPGVVFRGIYK